MRERERESHCFLTQTEFIISDKYMESDVVTREGRNDLFGNFPIFKMLIKFWSFVR